MLVVGGPSRFAERCCEVSERLGARCAVAALADGLAAAERGRPDLIVASQEAVAAEPEMFERLAALGEVGPDAPAPRARFVAFDAARLEAGELELVLSAALAGPDDEPAQE